MKPIYLTGFMGAGKTTIGKFLGERLRLPVIDTDLYIEEKIGKPIAQIFADDGEGVFRRYEREFLRMLPLDDVIVTTGGGIVIQKENREWMKQHGTVIYLHCEPEEIFRRLANDEARPLLKNRGKEQIQSLFFERLPYYKEADVIIDTTGKDVQEIVERIAAVLKSEE